MYKINTYHISGVTATVVSCIYHYGENVHRYFNRGTLDTLTTDENIETHEANDFG